MKKKKLKINDRVTTGHGYIKWGTVVNTFSTNRQRVKVLWDDSNRSESFFSDSLYKNGEKRFDGKILKDG